MYSTTDSGRAPYSSSVKKAPSSVPWGDVASAAAISTTMKVQAIATMCILLYEKYIQMMEYSVIMG